MENSSDKEGGAAKRQRVETNFDDTKKKRLQEDFDAILKLKNCQKREALNRINSEERPLLHRAAKIGEVEIVKWLVSSKGKGAGFDGILEKNWDGQTAMHIAARHGHLEVCKALASSNLSDSERLQMMNHPDKNKWTIFHHAVASGRTDLITWLFSDGEGGGKALGFKSELAVVSNFNVTILHAAARHAGSLEAFQVVLNLIGTNAKHRSELLNESDFDEWTVLHHAAAAGQIDIVTWLVSEGGRAAGFEKIVAKSACKYTALHLAARFGHLGACEAIVHSKVISSDQLKELLNNVDSNNWTLLHYLARNGLSSLITWLLSAEGGRAAGFNRILDRTYRGHSALDIAARQGHVEACKAIMNGCGIDNGARHAMLNSQSYGPLHHAAEKCHPEVISWLLSEEEGGGRSLGFSNFMEGRPTVLHIAIKRGHLESCKAIVSGLRVDNGERRETLNAVDDDGCTILHEAVRVFMREGIIAWILTEGVAAGFDRKNITALTKSESLSAIVLVQFKGQRESIEALLSHCTDQEKTNFFLYVDKKGLTALHHASRNLFDSARVMEVFLQYPECNLIINAKDEKGMTLLHRAILRGVGYVTPNDQYVPAVTKMLKFTSMDPNIGLEFASPRRLSR